MPRRLGVLAARLGVTLLGLSSCAREPPRFPPGEPPRAGLASVECRALQAVFPRLLAARPQGNVVLSPHALVRGLMAVGERDEARRQAILKFLSFAGHWDDLVRELDSAEGRLTAERLGLYPGVGDYVTAPAGETPAARFVYQSSVNESERGFRSVVDVQLAGVPMAGRPLAQPAWVDFEGRGQVPAMRMRRGAWFGGSADFSSAFWAAENDGEDTVPARLEGRAVVTLALATHDDAPPERLPVLPCAGGTLPEQGREVLLDLRAPTFCAKTSFALSAIDPPLAKRLAADVQLQARMAFDQRATVNLPKRTSASPGLIWDVGRHLPQYDFPLSRPFYATVHDRGSGALLYVAYIREPGAATACRSDADAEP